MRIWNTYHPGTPPLHTRCLHLRESSLFFLLLLDLKFCFRETILRRFSIKFTVFFATSSICFCTGQLEHSQPAAIKLSLMNCNFKSQIVYPLSFHVGLASSSIYTLCCRRLIGEQLAPQFKDEHACGREGKQAKKPITSDLSVSFQDPHHSRDFPCWKTSCLLHSLGNIMLEETGITRNGIKASRLLNQHRINTCLGLISILLWDTLYIFVLVHFFF